MADKKVERKDFEEFIQRKKFLLDENRPKSVEKRRAKGRRTARENIQDLCDSDSFNELGSLIIAAQKRRRPEQELIEETPADGLIAGIGSVNGGLFSPKIAKCCVLSYDYTVLAGTQGAFNHLKTDQMIEFAKRTNNPIIFFVEGGGGRPGDVDFDVISIGGLNIPTFVEYARLSGTLPRIAIVSGYCFAGNASIAGCSDVIIATEDSNLGMGGPAMIEGGGLGQFHPKEIGPASTQYKNGVIDILVKDEAAAVNTAKKYLSYFQGRIVNWKCPDQTKLRSIIPENRKFAYDMKKVINAIADTNSFLELRAGFALNMVTGFIRIEGRPIGLIANSTRYLGGAIDSNASDKATRFMQLCDAFAIPLLSLCDAPGFMVGPEVEESALVRHSSRMYVTGASLKVPIITIFIRKVYGLGAMAMCGGSTKTPLLSLAWPSAEFGAMGLEGAVKLGYKKELEGTKDEKEKEALYDKLVLQAYQKGKAIKAAASLEFDEVIDPKDSRKWIIAGLDSLENTTTNQRIVDTW